MPDKEGGGGVLPAWQQAQLDAQTQAQKQQAQQQALLQKYGPQVVSALNSGDYNTAWKDALASESGWSSKQNVGTAEADPLVAALESAQGLKAIDPSLTMNASQIQQYYDAFAQQTGTYQHGAGGTGFNGNLVGQNPYGIWGTAADSMAGVNAQAGVNAKAGGLADISNYLGARPDKSFLSKYGSTIATVAGDIGGSFIGDPMLGNELVGLYDATQGNWGGAFTNLASGFIPGAGAALGDATGLGTGVGTVLAGAVVGGTKAGLTGGDVLTGAETGAIGGVIQQGITSSGLGSAINDTVGSTAGNIATKVIGGELTSLATNALTSGSSSSGGKVSTPADQLGTVTTTPSTSSGTDAGNATPPASSGGGGVLSSLGSILPSVSTLTNAAPYAAAAAVGTYEADKGRAADQKYVNQLTALGNQDINASKQLYGNYINNKLNPQDQALLNNANKTLSDIAANSAGLSSIAKTAFTNYENGVLPAWQQAQLDAQTEAQKQQVAQQLSSAGISDSTILASAYANIDNQASITKGQLLQQNFSTGTAAYDEFLKGTQEGNSILATATQTADNTLNSELQAALSAFGTGSGIVQNAIDTAMKTDQQYSAELAALYGTLTAAYLKQYQTKNPNVTNGGTKLPTVSTGGNSGGGGHVGTPSDTGNITPNGSGLTDNQKIGVDIQTSADTAAATGQIDAAAQASLDLSNTQLPDLSNSLGDLGGP
jgi:hypothetical protein